MLRPDENGNMVPVISYEEAKRLTEDEIISRFHFDHYPVPKALDGPDEPWNLKPLPVADHREKTAKVDIPAIAKAKRIAKKRDAALKALAELDSEEIVRSVPEKKRRSTFPTSRDSKWKKKLSGEIVER